MGKAKTCLHNGVSQSGSGGAFALAGRRSPGGVLTVGWRLEAVEWEDVTSISRFTLDHDFESERLFKLSVGFIIHETPEYVVLADDVDTSRRRDSPNNYGTIIPKGCIRSRQVIHQEAPMTKSQGRKAEPRTGQSVRRFLKDNPHIMATAHDISLRIGLDQSEVQRQLAELERAGEARQTMPGLWQAEKYGARNIG